MTDEMAMPDFGSLLGQAQAMMAASAQAAEEIIEGQSGGGAVRVRVNGRFEFSAIEILPAAVDPRAQLVSLKFAEPTGTAKAITRTV